MGSYTTKFNAFSDSKQEKLARGGNKQENKTLEGKWKERGTVNKL